MKNEITISVNDITGLTIDAKGKYTTPIALFYIFELLSNKLDIQVNVTQND